MLSGLEILLFRTLLHAFLLFRRCPHNEQLHEVNMSWYPKAGEVLWKPGLQEAKYSQTGGKNVRYKRELKKKLVDSLVDMVHEHMPYCPIRYAF